MTREELFLRNYKFRKKQYLSNIVRNITDIQQEIIVKNNDVKYRYSFIVYFFDNPYKKKERSQITVDKPLNL